MYVLRLGIAVLVYASARYSSAIACVVCSVSCSPCFPVFLCVVLSGVCVLSPFG